MSVGRKDYEERKERRIFSYKERARKAVETANQEYSNAQEMGSVIPFGQPILVGHHSEDRHRALLKGIDAKHRKAFAESGKAEYYENKAESAEANQSISGDDPEAENRYQEKLEILEKKQNYMKAVNKAWKHGKDALIALGLSEAESDKLANEPKRPCPTWMLSNNSAEIRRVKEKLARLKKLDNMETQNIKFNGGEMQINTMLNRVQFIFGSIPSPETRAFLKARGFKWARSQGAWQRQRTLNAISTAKYLIQEYFNKIE